tara:strand:- start:1959 stop:3089 length:1131 start_codon:yes stop_codon:yes gene_type:complete
MLVQNVSVTDVNFSKAKSRFKSSATNSSEYNKVLDKYTNAIRKINASIMGFDHAPSKDEFKQLVNKEINGTDYKVKNFRSFLDYFIDNSKNKISPSTLRQYKSSIKTFIEFENHIGLELQFSSFNMELYDSLIDYYYNVRKNANNTIGNRIKHLKAILNYAYKRDYIKNRLFDSYAKPSSQTDDIYLTFDEYKDIESVELDNKSDDIVRDLFLVGCESGLRFEDYSNLRRDNFKDDLLTVITLKTKQKVTVPVSPTLKRILKKYGSSFPTFKRNSLFNIKIKEVCKKAGIDTKTTLKKDVNGTMVDVSKPKYEWVSTHTARRSFATNYYMETDAQIYDIMSITGHKTEKQFLNYIKKNRKEPIKSLVLAINKRFKK